MRKRINNVLTVVPLERGRLNCIGTVTPRSPSPPST
jgi:hypothetical protein